MSGSVMNGGSATPPGTGYEGQTFLVGERAYLRGIEEADARFTVSWRQTPFPISPGVTEEWIKEDLAKERNPILAVVRKQDDRVVGSIRVEREDLDHWLEPRVDALLGDDGQRDLAEAIALVAQWLVDERGQPVVHVMLAACDGIVIEALEAAGMRQTARFRQMLLRDGQRMDQLLFEYLGARWMENLGDPNEALLERTGSGETRPVPSSVMLDGDPPPNAMMVGSRVYLRPEELDDAEVVALLSRRETEAWFDIGRHFVTEARYRDWIASYEKKDVPDWITFAVCLRENDERIGWVALLDVDYQHGFAETGSYLAHPDYRGGGYGSEAKHLLLEYAFERLGLHMVHSWVFFANTRSAAALRKQGYAEAGRANWIFANEGRLDNFALFDLLAEEWRALPREAWSPGMSS